MSIDFLKKYDIYFVIICICFCLSSILGYDQANSFISLLIFPLLIIYYFKDSINKNKYLLYFLILFCFSEIYYYFQAVLHIIPITTFEGKPQYIESSVALVIGYASLIALIISELNLKQLIKRLYIQIFILGVLGVYLIFKLNYMITYNISMPIIEYSINVLYNLVIVVLLGLSLLNYLYHYSTLALRLLIACVFLILSEFVQTAFHFMESEKFLSEIYIIMLAISYFAFFLYIKATKVNTKIA